MGNTSRTFTASLKPAWSRSKIDEFCLKLTGVATVFCINHDRDFNEETGELKETHTHILLDYETPRKITTVANLLEVEPNFIELVKSKKAMMKYLIHQDEPEKAQYQVAEVITNSTVPYDELILGQSLSDREIANHIRNGRGVELLGVVSATKLRTIQAFLQFDRSGIIQAELKAVNEKLERLTRFVDTVEYITRGLIENINVQTEQLVSGILKIADEIEKVRKVSGRTTHKPIR